MEILQRPLKFLSEELFESFQLLVEQENPTKPASMKVSGPMIVCEQSNANKRIYSRQCMTEAVSEYTQRYINTNSAFGELEHPNSVKINPERIAHRILTLENDNNIWKGTSQIVTGTPCGDVVAAILRTGGRLGFSTRGVGDITSNGRVERYKLAAVDIVLTPSGPGCFADPLLESKSYMINEHGEIMEIAYERMENKLSALPLRAEDRQRVILEAFKEFIKSV